MRQLKVICFSFFFMTALLGCQEEKPANSFVVLETDMGEVVIKLYEDTPIHKQNFIELVEKGLYNGVIFHRIVSNFMVQTGDPDTRASGASSSDKEVDYTLKAELSLDHVHTAGKVAAAREPDEFNPEKRSSGSQFYIVTGRPVSSEELTQIEEERNAARKATLYQEFQKIEQNPDTPIDFELFLEHKGYKEYTYYDEKKRASYTRLGGAPHLDFEYTIFGEVVNGMDVVKRIEQVPTEGERPLKAVRIISARVMTPESEQQLN